MVAKNVAAMTVVDMPEVDVKAAAELVDPFLSGLLLSLSAARHHNSLSPPPR